MATLEARALSALEAYLDLDPLPRARALALLRASDPDLHAEVVRLLEADAVPGALAGSPQDILAGFGPPADARTGGPVDDPRIGSVLGAWRIEAPIGAGGMGRVYRASRADGQYAQVVALKCVATEIDSPVLAEAIRNERSTLALLEHPNIATLLDGGIDAGGYPWFAMQLVQGEPIDRWCDARAATLRDRVALFVRLCDGLAYAHAKSALHSDIKPSNVLVDAGGRPVLLDFGLSSLARPGWTSSGRQVAMTPDYTAPETASDGYSVRTDIYALGVVLYGLLCGVTPHAAPGADAGTPPPPPSHAAARGRPEAARARSLASPAELSRALSGDLDAIAMACIAHDPNRRYASVAALQADLRAWLGRMPVSVARRGGAYRAGLFLRRHRVGALLAACALLVLCVGLGWAYRVQRESERHAEVARSMRQLFDDSLGIMTATSPGPSPLLSDAMLQAAEAKLRRRSAGAAPQVRAYGLLALAKSYAVAGNYRHAQALVSETRALVRDDESQAALVDATVAHLANLRAHYAEALRAARAGLDRIGAVADDERDAVRLALEVELARGLRSTGRVVEGQAVLGRALSLAETLAAGDPKPLAELLILHGEWAALYYRFEQAERDYRRAIALTARDAPMIADTARAALANNLSFQDHDDQGLPIAREVLANRRRMFGEDHPETGKAWVLVATIEAASRSGEPDTDAASRGVAILRAALGPDHPEVARAMQISGWNQVRRDPKSLDQVVADARRALRIVQRSNGPSTPQAIGAMVHLAAMLASQGDGQPGSKPVWPEVISLYARATEMGARQGMPMLWPRATLVRAKLRAGQTGPALETELKQVEAELARARGPRNPRVLETRAILVELYVARKDYAAAIAGLQSLVRDTAGASPGSDLEALRVGYLGSLGEGLKERGDVAGARTQLQEGRALSERLHGAGHPVSKWFDAQLAQLPPDKVVAQRR